MGRARVHLALAPDEPRGPELGYAFATLADALGLAAVAAPGPGVRSVPLDRGEPAPGSVRRRDLERAFRLLTLADEARLRRDEHGRPVVPRRALPAEVGDLARHLAAALDPVERARYAGGERFCVALTHDVDELGGGGLPRAARKALLGGLVRPWSAAARRRRLEARAYVEDRRAGRDPAFPLGDLLAAERAHGWRSSLFFLARHTGPRDGDGRRYRRHLPAALAAAGEAGLEIGLHASYAARERDGALAEEAAALARLTGSALRALRHHFLRSDPERLPAEMQAAHLDLDSSLGWSAFPGLRAGSPFPYRLWDAGQRAPGPWELPLAVMDTSLLRHRSLDGEAAFRVAVAALRPVVEHGGACALLWHPPYHHPRLLDGYDRVYRRLLAWIDEQGGFAGPASEVLDRWRARRAGVGPVQG